MNDAIYNLFILNCLKNKFKRIIGINVIDIIDEFPNKKKLIALGVINCPVNNSGKR